jgi:hypothetical protein
VPERRIAVLPLALAAVGVVIAVVFTFVIVGLATGGPAPAPTGAAPQPPVSATPAPAAPVEPRRAAEVNECVDALGDGAIDLDAARVGIDDNRLVVEFDLAAELPAGNATLGVYAVSEDGATIYQLAATWNDGELDEFFTQKFGVGQRDDNRGRGNDKDRDDQEGDVEVDDLDFDDIQVSGTTVVAEFPRDVLRDLDDDWSWYAFSAVDGSEVDACPGEVLTFETQPFVD